MRRVAGGSGDVQRAARDAAILVARAEGATLAEIGERFGLSGERVRQVLAAAGKLDSQGARETRTARRRAAAAARWEEVVDAWRSGAEASAVASDLGLARGDVDAVLRDHVQQSDRVARRRAKAVGRLGAARRRHTEAELTAAVRLAVERTGALPTGKRYSEIAAGDGLPSMSTLENRFGSWSGALRAAGFTPARTGRPSYSSRWTEAACLEVARRVAAERGGLPSVREYEALARGRTDLPSAATLKKRFGSWSALALRLEARAVGGGRS